MIGLANLLKKIDNRVKNKQNRSQAAYEGIVYITAPGTYSENKGNQQETGGNDSYALFDGLVPDKPPYIESEQGIFDDIKNIPQQEFLDRPCLVKIGIKQFIYKTIDQINQNNP